MVKVGMVLSMHFIIPSVFGILVHKYTLRSIACRSQIGIYLYTAKNATDLLQVVK